MLHTQNPSLQLDLTDSISLARCCQWLHQTRQSTNDMAVRRLIDDVTQDLWTLAGHIDRFADDVADAVVGALASVEAAIEVSNAA